MDDSAAHALAKVALAPEWEATFEPNSDGFRPGRSGHDAIAASYASINHQDTCVLDADIATCVDRIDPQALLAKLNTFPALRRTIHTWLKAGVMDGEQLFPTEAGTPQGGPLSPLLAHVALHGLETAIETAFPAYQDRHRWKPKVVRYADDCVGWHTDREVMRQAQAIASTWLQRMGLAWKPRNTRIAQTRHPVDGVAGFDCLGFHIRQYPVGTYKTGTTGPGKPLGFNTHIKPSREAQRTHLQQIKEDMRTRRAASQAQLLRKLTPLIWGWSHSDSTVVAKATFSRMESLGVRHTSAMGTPSPSPKVRMVGA
jgi:RNA-directed DNA polymerase